MNRFTKKTRLAFVCFSDSDGGLELTTVRLAEESTRRGAFVRVIGPDGSPLQQFAAESGIPIASLSPRIKYGDLAAALRLARILRSDRTEVVVLTRSADLHLAALAHTLFSGFRIVFYQQMQSGLRKTDLLHSWVHSHVGRWLTLTTRMRDDVLALTHMSRDRVDVVHLGRDTKSFDPALFDRQECRKQFSLGAEEFVVGMLGRLDPQKGQEEFLHACAALRNRPAMKFIVAGDETRNESGYRQKIERMIDALGIRASIRLVPAMRDVRPYLASLDVFVMPSHAETYGLVLIEAMAMAIPVVATNAGGVPEIVRDGTDGSLIPPRSPSDLALALTRLADDAVLRARLGTNAHQRAVEQFDSEVCADRFVAAVEAC